MIQNVVLDIGGKVGEFGCWLFAKPLRAHLVGSEEETERTVEREVVSLWGRLEETE